MNLIPVSVIAYALFYGGLLSALLSIMILWSLWHMQLLHTGNIIFLKIPTGQQ